MRRFVAACAALGAVAVVIPAAALAKPQVLLVGTYHGIKGQYKTIQAAVDAARPDALDTGRPGRLQDQRRADAGGPPGSRQRDPDQDPRPLPSRHEPQRGGGRRHQAGLAAVQHQSRGPELRSGELEGADGAERDDGLEGTRRVGAEPDRLQLPRRLRRYRQRDLVERRRRQRQDRRPRLLRLVPERHHHVLQRPRRRPPSTGSSPATGPAARGTTRTRATSTTPATTSAPASSSATRRSTTPMGEFNALGYSGSNSGGKLVVENSEFDNNEDGFDTNSQNGDNPPPQNGACPNGGISPITHTHSCWVFMDNYVHDNNNPNIPAAGRGRGGPGRHRHDDLRRSQRHGDEQPVRQQQRLGSRRRSPTRTTARRAPAVRSTARSPAMAPACWTTMATR